MERLKDPAMRARMKKDITTPQEDWYNHYQAVGGDWSAMQLVSLSNPKNKEFTGKQCIFVFHQQDGKPILGPGESDYKESGVWLRLTLRGTKATGAEALSTISHTAGSVIASTVEVGGDLGAAAKGLVEGAIHSAKDVSLSAEAAASAAGTGALEAAGKLGSKAGQTVRDALSGTISGTKVVLKEPFKSAR